jgi:hypothetical protein
LQNHFRHCRYFHGSPSEKVVVGVVGTNSRGATLANIFAGTTNVEVGYICDVDENVLIKPSH